MKDSRIKIHTFIMSLPKIARSKFLHNSFKLLILFVIIVLANCLSQLSMICGWYVAKFENGVYYDGIYHSLYDTLFLGRRDKIILFLFIVGLLNLISYSARDCFQKYYWMNFIFIIFASIVLLFLFETV
jgi:hypothetical protein